MYDLNVQFMEYNNAKTEKAIWENQCYNAYYLVMGVFFFIKIGQRRCNNKILKRPC